YSRSGEARFGSVFSRSSFSARLALGFSALTIWSWKRMLPLARHSQVHLHGRSNIGHPPAYARDDVIAVCASARSSVCENLRGIESHPKQSRLVSGSVPRDFSAQTLLIPRYWLDRRKT